MSTEAMKMALVALELCNGASTVEGINIYTDEEIGILRQAIAEAEKQRNVTKEEHDVLIKAALRSATVVHDGFLTPKVNMLNTLAQPQPDHMPDATKMVEPKRKPLTDEQIRKASLEAGMQEHYMDFHSGFVRFARAIEAAHGIKENT